MFGRALGDFGQVDFDAGPRARGGFTGRAGQTRGAHVLDAGDGAGGQQFQASFADQLFHERIAHLHGAPLLFGRFLRQILRGECRSGQAVPTGGRADVEDRVAHAFGARRARFGRGAARRGRRR